MACPLTGDSRCDCRRRRALLLVGTLAAMAMTQADDTECRKIGYVGAKRYVRLTLTPTGNAAGAIPIAAIALLGNPASSPTATL